MSKIDFKKEWKHLYKPSAKEFVLVDVPPMQYLMVDGHGDPNVAQDIKKPSGHCTPSRTRSSSPARRIWERTIP
jgi:hypothetical protein